MKSIAIIPARGGSKRLPRKNILPLLGRPMLSYPIKTALKTKMFDQVIVSTEDVEIKEKAKEAGAVVMDRPEHLAGDRVGVVDVCIDVLEQYTKDDSLPDFFCCIYATAVFILERDIRQSFQIFKDDPKTDVVMGVSGFNLQPMQALKEDDEGCLNHQWPEFTGVQSQFHPELKASNGTLYWTRTQPFLNQKTFYPKALRGFDIPWIRALDIDTPEDYENVRQFAQVLMDNPK